MVSDMDLKLLSNGNMGFEDFVIGMTADEVFEILSFKDLDFSKHYNETKKSYNLIIGNYVQNHSGSTRYDLVLSIDETKHLSGFDISKSNCSKFIGKFAYKELANCLHSFIANHPGVFWSKNVIDNENGFINQSYDNGLTSIWLYYNNYGKEVDVSLGFWSDILESDDPKDARRLYFSFLNSNNSVVNNQKQNTRHVSCPLWMFWGILLFTFGLIISYSVGYSNAKSNETSLIDARDKVYVSDSPGSKRYHKDRNCPALKRTTGKITRTDESNAIDQGKTLCGWCGK